MPNSADVETFEKALEARFPPSEPISVEDTERQLLSLEQGPSEYLNSYHGRVERLLHVLGGVDRNEAPFTIEEEIVLRKVGDGFGLGLRDNQ